MYGNGRRIVGMKITRVRRQKAVLGQMGTAPNGFCEAVLAVLLEAVISIFVSPFAIRTIQQYASAATVSVLQEIFN